MDPAVHATLRALKLQLQDRDKKLKEKEEELDAIQFTTQSLTGKKLLAKCRLLQEENEDFAKQLSEDRIHKLENQLALHKELVEELKKSLEGGRTGVSAD